MSVYRVSKLKSLQFLAANIVRSSQVCQCFRYSRSKFGVTVVEILFQNGFSGTLVRSFIILKFLASLNMSLQRNFRPYVSCEQIYLL